MADKKITYAEPTDFFPKEIRKKYGLGEYNKDVGGKGKTAAKKTSAKKPTNKKK